MAERSEPNAERERERKREARARRARRGGLIALARARLRRSPGGRFGRALGVLVVLGFGGAILMLRVSDGGQARLEGLVSAAAHWVAWLVGAPVALAAAADRGAL